MTVATVGLGLSYAPRTKLRTGPAPRLSRNRRDYDRRRRLSKRDGDTLRYMALLRHDPCILCGVLPPHGEVQDVDHIVPLGQGGDDDWTNMAAACGPCNRGRRDRDLLASMLRRLPPEATC